MDTLYKIDANDSVREWTIWRQGSEVCIKYGVQDGQKISDCYTPEPKNTGKINATTVEEQCDAEIASRIKKQLRLHYGRDIAEAKKKKFTFKPMKLEQAVDINAAGTLVTTKYFDKLPQEVLWQTKLDGVWCSVQVVDGEVSFRSRGNTEYEIMQNTQLATELRQLTVSSNIHLVGELHNPKYRETVVAGAVKAKTERPVIHELKFEIFDVYWEEFPEFNETAYTSRMDEIEFLTGSSDRFLYTQFQRMDKNNILSFLKAEENLGHEGGVIRTPNCMYRSGKRSQEVLKVKRFDTTDYELLGVTLGKRVVLQFDGFTSSYNGTMDEQMELYENQEDYIGKLGVIKHFRFTEDGLPKFPKCLEIVAIDLKN